MNFPETVIAGVHAAVASTLTCDAMPPSKARTALQDAALDLCRQATREAQAIAAATGNGRPLELAELIAANLGAKASACKPKTITSTSS